jgi:uncharacterized glyoxalase superfamily protein PhnB
VQKISPFLWFDDRAEEAMKVYVSIFKNSKIEALERYEAGERGLPGTVKHGRFSLDGLEFMAMFAMAKLDIEALQRAYDGKTGSALFMETCVMRRSRHLERKHVSLSLM